MLITVCSTFTHQTTGLSKKCSSSIDVLSPVRTEATEAVEEETLIAIALFFLFLFNDTATTAIYTLSLHDALPIWAERRAAHVVEPQPDEGDEGDPQRAADEQPERGGHHTQGQCLETDRSPQLAPGDADTAQDRKSTRLNSSHPSISYAVFCLKKKK